MAWELAEYGPSRFATVTAKLVYVGSNVLLYQDTVIPAPGMTGSI